MSDMEIIHGSPNAGPGAVMCGLPKLQKDLAYSTLPEEVTCPECLERMGIVRVDLTDKELLECIPQLRKQIMDLQRGRMSLLEQNQKLRKQVQLRGKHLSLLEAKLAQWNQAIIEGARTAGYSLKFDDPDHDYSTGWPPGLYPSHVEKLLQHVLDTKGQQVTELLGERVLLEGKLEVKENENQELGRHLIGMTRALQQVREALEIGPVGDVVRASKEARALLQEVEPQATMRDDTLARIRHFLGQNEGRVLKEKDAAREAQRVYLPDLLRCLLWHKGECWTRNSDGTILYNTDMCQECFDALTAWEPCPYCTWAREKKLNRTQCPQCAKYPVAGWREKK